jgi:hypothetical protein
MNTTGSPKTPNQNTRALADIQDMTQALARSARASARNHQPSGQRAHDATPQLIALTRIARGLEEIGAQLEWLNRPKSVSDYA